MDGEHVYGIEVEGLLALEFFVSRDGVILEVIVKVAIEPFAIGLAAAEFPDAVLFDPAGSALDVLEVREDL